MEVNECGLTAPLCIRSRFFLNLYTRLGLFMDKNNHYIYIRWLCMSILIESYIYVQLAQGWWKGVCSLTFYTQLGFCKLCWKWGDESPRCWKTSAACDRKTIAHYVTSALSELYSSVLNKQLCLCVWAWVFCLLCFSKLNKVLPMILWSVIYLYNTHMCVSSSMMCERCF